MQTATVIKFKKPENCFPDHFFTAMPGISDPSLLSHYFKKCLKFQIIKHLELCTSSLHLNLSETIKKIIELDCSTKWSPAIYLAAHELKTGMKEKNVTSIMDAVFSIENMLKTSIYHPNLKIDTILTETWEKNYIQIMRNDDGTNAKGESIIVMPLINNEFEKYIPDIKMALQLIKDVAPDLSREFDYFVTHIKLFQGRSLMGVTSTLVFGSIFLRVPDPGVDAVPYFIEHIVHELSHLNLYQLMAQDPLVLNHPYERFRAPIRVDLRPMYGVYHATYVLSRMIFVFKLLSRNPEYGVEISRQLSKFCSMFESGYGVVSEHGKLSELGLRVLLSSKECLA